MLHKGGILNLHIPSVVQRERGGRMKPEELTGEGVVEAECHHHRHGCKEVGAIEVVEAIWKAKHSTHRTGVCGNHAHRHSLSKKIYLVQHNLCKIKYETNEEKNFLLIHLHSTCLV